jgi:DNA-binding HxlR family transcriptional regulator
MVQTTDDVLSDSILQPVAKYKADARMQADVTMTMRNEGPRSFCPISLSLEVFGDSWTLLILRDMMFGGKRHFREMLQSDEHISSNILADRLKTLVEHGLLTKTDDPTHRQKAVYSLTEKGIALLPVIVQIGAWGSRYVPASKKLDARSRAFIRELQEGGPAAWKRIMSNLRETHLGRRTSLARNDRRGG